MFCCSVSYRKVTNYSAMWRCSGWVNVIFWVVEGGGIRRFSEAQWVDRDVPLGFRAVARGLP